MVKKIISCVLLLLISFIGRAQRYTDSIKKYQETYKHEFLTDARSPLQKKDLAFIAFYKINKAYKVLATIALIDDTVGFDMQTHSGVIKKYYVYAKATFVLHNNTQVLYIYQSKDLMKKGGLEDYLFLPFTDATNYTTTFGGGRYLDFKMKDIHNKMLWIDFNKAYNPYCAYKVGYNCPIPPKENALQIPIPVGEKLFGKKTIE